MKRISKLLITAVIITVIASSLAGCSQVSKPGNDTLTTDFENYLTLGNQMPFTYSAAMRSPESLVITSVKGGYDANVQFDVTVKYMEETFGIYEYDVLMHYGADGMNYILSNTVHQTEGFDADVFFAGTNWEFSPELNHDYPIERIQKMEMPTAVQIKELTEAESKQPEEGMNRRMIGVVLTFTEELQNNDVKMKFYQTEKHEDDLELEFEWDFKMSYLCNLASSNIYLEYVHRTGVMNDMENWVLVARAQSELKASVIYQQAL